MDESAGFNAVLESDFPGSTTLDAYIDGTRLVLEPFGFKPNNTLATVCVCRDERTRALVKRVEGAWGEAFNFSGLGGLFFAGTTGIQAAIQHAPQVTDRERYIFYCLPHIALGVDGTYGVCERAGRLEKSVACGALFAFAEEWLAGEMSFDLNPQDMEQSILRQRLARELSADAQPNLKEITELAHDVTLNDLEDLLDKVVDLSIADYVVFSGIQVHGPGQSEYVWARSSYWVHNGEKQFLTLPYVEKP